MTDKELDKMGYFTATIGRMKHGMSSKDYTGDAVICPKYRIISGIESLQLFLEMFPPDIAVKSVKYFPHVVEAVTKGRNFLGKEEGEEG